MVDYLKYLKNNPKGYWFKRKMYGWGWVPVKWQGWLAILTWMTLLIVSINLIKNDVHEAGKNLAIILFFTAMLLWICYKKGEKPKWSWGK